MKLQGRSVDEEEARQIGEGSWNTLNRNLDNHGIQKLEWRRNGTV